MRTPPDPDNYNRMVWTIVKQIPPGVVSTYGQIASMIPPPENVIPPTYDRFSPQWVGKAMNNTPEGHGIPWQRVINSQGKISLPEDGAGARQRRLLEAEGVVFNDKDRVDFEVCGWDGPEESFLRKYGLYPPKRLKKQSGGDDNVSQPKLL